MPTTKFSLKDYDIWEMMLKNCPKCNASGTLASMVAGPISSENMVMVYCMNEKCRNNTELYPALNEAVNNWNN